MARQVTNALWSKLKDILRQHRVYDKPFAHRFAKLPTARSGRDLDEILEILEILDARSWTSPPSLKGFEGF
jgi:hypothetical protein